VVARIAATEDAAALACEGVTVVDGTARFVDRRTIDVDGRRLRARRFVVATGARPSLPPVPGLADADPLTSENIFELAAAPRSLAVLGAGPIGVELASALARLGVEVTLFEGLERILPREEPAASSVVAGVLARSGVRLRPSCSVSEVERVGAGSLLVHGAHGGPVPAEAVLVAGGRAPAGAGFGLEEIGVELNGRGAIVVDDTMATTVPGIWAAGDVVGRAQFTHAAARMGWVAAANALSRTARVRRFRFSERVLPRAIFTTPEVGRVGLLESEAVQRHPGSRVAFLPLSHVDRAIATGAEDGFVKLIAGPRPGLRGLAGGRLLGATVVAPTGGDLVHEVALGMQTGMFTGRLVQTTHAYPTWSSAIQQAALQFFGMASGLTARPAGTDPADDVVRLAAF